MKKLNKKQKVHFKKILKRTLNIFCYICTALLALFLLIFSIQSCQNRTFKGVSAEGLTDNSYYHYSTGYDPSDEFTLNNDDRKEWCAFFDVSTGGDIPSGSYQYKRTNVETSFLYYISSGSHRNWVHIKEIEYKIQAVQLGQVSMYVPYTLRLINTNGVSFSIFSFNRIDLQTGALVYNQGTCVNFYLRSQIEVPTQAFTITYNDSLSYDFLRLFNYNSLLGGNLNSQFLPLLPSWDGDDNSWTITLGYHFACDDEAFWSIEFTFHRADDYYWNNGNGLFIQGPSNACFLRYIGYHYYDGNTIDTKYKLIASRDYSYGYAENGTFVQSFSNDLTWVSDKYRHLVFLDIPNAELSLQLEAFNNFDFDYINGINYGGNVGGNYVDVFTLLGGAFTSWASIFGATLLPGLTIGTLLFLPLVVGIVLSIVHLIKK